MNLLAAKLYDPSVAVSKATSALLAMTAFDTTNLRLAVTVPAHGMVMFKGLVTLTGATTLPVVFLGVLNGATVIVRATPTDFAGTMAASTQTVPCRFEAIATGLTPGAANFDLAYGVDVLVAATAFKYGGPNDTTTANAWGAAQFEAWDPQPMTPGNPLTIDASGRVDVSKVAGTAQTARDLGAQLDAAVSTRMATYTQPTGFLAATFPTSVASPTNITAGTITTVTNLTNAPTAGDLTATMKASVTTAATAATPTAAAVTGAVGSVTGAVGSVTGAVGSVTGNVGGSVASVVGAVGSVTAGVTLAVSQHVIVDSGTVTTLTNLPAIPAGWLTATGIAAGALNGKGDWLLSSGYTAPPSAATIAGATWDVTLSGHLTAGTTGAALNSAGAAGDPWATALPGAYGAGTAGKIIGTNLDAAISSRSTYAGGAVASVTGNVGGNVTGSVGSVTGAVASVTAAVTLPAIPTNWITATGITAAALNGKGDWNIGKTGYSLVTGYDPAKTAAQAGDAMALTSGERTTIAAAIWNALTSGMTTVGSLGKKLADWTIGTAQTGDAFARLGAPTGASVAADVAAVKADTAAVKTQTDQLAFTVAGQADVNLKSVAGTAVAGSGTEVSPWGPA